MASPATWTDTSLLVWDLLWPARQPPATGALDDPTTYASPDTAYLPPLDLQDVMVERIRGNLLCAWTSGTGTSIASSLTYGVTTDSNFHIGLQVDNLDDSGFNDINPKRFPAAATMSWMDYAAVPLFAAPFNGGEIGTGKNVCCIPLDVKSRRRLRDWGDNLYLIAGTSGLGDATGTTIQGTVSVLISHR